MSSSNSGSATAIQLQLPAMPSSVAAAVAGIHSHSSASLKASPFNSRQQYQLSHMMLTQPSTDSLGSSVSHYSLDSNATVQSQSPSTATATAAAAAGSSLGRRRTPHDFVFGRSLGEGSFSTVVEGFEPLTNKYFAVKILDKQHLMRENKTATAITEKDALHRLHRHPFIVKLHYTFQDASSLYFVIDLATNGELLGFIRKHGSLSERAARFYTAELIDALEYMHAKGVIHRDVKPENCLLAQNMHLKITDFGSAKLITSSEGNGADRYRKMAINNNASSVSRGEDGEGMQRRQRASSFVGTAEYVSPELLSNKPVDKECDFWAVGCILFQMISGKPPFKGSTEYLTFQKVMKLDYSFPENFPQEARSLIEKLLVLEPSERLGHVSFDYQTRFGAPGGIVLTGADGAALRNEDDIRQHVFFTSLDATDKDRFTWTELHNQIPPPMESGIVQPPSQSSSNQPNWNDFIAKANAAINTNNQLENVFGPIEGNGHYNNNDDVQLVPTGTDPLSAIQPAVQLHRSHSMSGSEHDGNPEQGEVAIGPVADSVSSVDPAMKARIDSKRTIKQQSLQKHHKQLSQVVSDSRMTDKVIRKSKSTSVLSRIKGMFLSCGNQSHN